MKRIHIGHHFYGSGNLGDDLMLDGFLSQFNSTEATFSCCTPYKSSQLENRFPQVNWLPYTIEERLKAIQASDIWLGLGGSPFQNSVSTWFTDHLIVEANLCNTCSIPMLYLGIGAQESDAFKDPRLIEVFTLSKHIWTRDEETFDKLLKHGLPTQSVSIGSDLAHICFSIHTLSSIKSQQIAATLNFDYLDWEGLLPTLQSLENSSYKEKIWLIQETRNLKGSEQDLYKLLPPILQKSWKPQFADIPYKSMKEVLGNWPASEWVITSRYHTTLASAWAGSKTVVLAINDKLKNAAYDCDYPYLEKKANPREIIKALENSEPAKLAKMLSHASVAKKAVNEFKAFINQ